MLDRTKAKENWQGKRVLVLGMARSGIAVAQLLCRFGAVPLLNDRKTEQELGETLAPSGIWARTLKRCCRSAMCC